MRECKGKVVPALN